jgi:hypothetical protein
MHETHAPCLGHATRFSSRADAATLAESTEPGGSAEGTSSQAVACVVTPLDGWEQARTSRNASRRAKRKVKFNIWRTDSHNLWQTDQRLCVT